jgi:hypothetical protein
MNKVGKKMADNKERISIAIRALNSNAFNNSTLNGCKKREI